MGCRNNTPCVSCFHSLGCFISIHFLFSPVCATQNERVYRRLQKYPSSTLSEGRGAFDLRMEGVEEEEEDGGGGCEGGRSEEEGWRQADFERKPDQTLRAPLKQHG